MKTTFTVRRFPLGHVVATPGAHFQASDRYHLTEQQDRELMALYDAAEADRKGAHGEVLPDELPC
jgi:myo-inositol catabolism protein IolC